MGGKYNDITPTGHIDILQHMNMALLLKPIVSKSQQTDKIEKPKQNRKQSRKVVVELDF